MAEQRITQKTGKQEERTVQHTDLPFSCNYAINPSHTYTSFKVVFADRSGYLVSFIKSREYTAPSCGLAPSESKRLSDTD